MIISGGEWLITRESRRCLDVGTLVVRALRWTFEHAAFLRRRTSSVEMFAVVAKAVDI